MREAMGTCTCLTARPRNVGFLREFQHKLGGMKPLFRTWADTLIVAALALGAVTSAALHPYEWLRYAAFPGLLCIAYLIGRWPH
jgi:hypothetical protein